MSFTAAISQLSQEIRESIEDQLRQWSEVHQWRHVALNIQAETALPVAAFKSLLEAFGSRLETKAGREDPGAAWVEACREHQFQGAVLCSPHRPDVIGRALTFEHFANMVVPSSGLPQGTVAGLLTTYGNRDPKDVPDRVRSVLRGAKVGKFVIWATFCVTHPTDDPFAHLSLDKTDVITALGLGHLLSAETLVLLAYKPLRNGSPEPLHRPSVVEAEGGHFYRPHPDPAHPYGHTLPLTPNSRGFGPQPEVVHRELVAEGLLLPFRLAF